MVPTMHYYCPVHIDLPCTKFKGTTHILTQQSTVVAICIAFLPGWQACLICSGLCGVLLPPWCVGWSMESILLLIWIDTLSGQLHNCCLSSLKYPLNCSSKSFLQVQKQILWLTQTVLSFTHLLNNVLCTESLNWK